MKDRNKTLGQMKAVWAYLALYFSVLFLLITFEDNFSIAEPLFILILIGVGFSLAAIALTRKALPFDLHSKAINTEITWLLISLACVLIYLIAGFEYVNSLFALNAADQTFLSETSTLLQKLFIFVAIPLLIYKLKLNLSPGALGFRFNQFGSTWKSHMPALFGMTAMLLVFQFFVGSGAEPFRSGQYSFYQLLIGLPIAMFWLCIEVGLVEEFFFRTILQTRLAIYLKSEISAIILVSLIFGLVHAPGLYLRGAGTITLAGANPSLLLAVGYSIVILSVTGFFLGIIWMRTRNLPLIVMIHAATDLLPNFSEIMEFLGLFQH